MATTCTIVYRNSKWYASITVNCQPIRETGIGAVGIDFGTLTAVACSDGTKIENPRFLGKTQTKIKHISKQKRSQQAPNFKKKIKASKRWKKTTKKVAKLQRQVANQRFNWRTRSQHRLLAVIAWLRQKNWISKGWPASLKKAKERLKKLGSIAQSLIQDGECCEAWLSISWLSATACLPLYLQLKSSQVKLAHLAVINVKKNYLSEFIIAHVDLLATAMLRRQWLCSIGQRG